MAGLVLAQLPRQVCRSRVVVALQKLDRFMPGNCRQLEDVLEPFGDAASSLMAQVVEMKICNARALACPHEHSLQGFTSNGENKVVVVSGQTFEGFDCAT